jgi:hypothetical protein
MYKKFLIIFFIFTSTSAFAQLANNFKIFPSSVTQTEPVICFNPTNPLMMFASAVTVNTSTGEKSEGIYVSTDGGFTFTGSDVCNGPAANNHGGDPGVAIDKNGVFVLTHIGLTFIGVYGHYSTDFGSNWSVSYQITNQTPEDKGTTISDNDPSSPYYGNVYTAWVKFISPYPVTYSYTSNGGLNWTSPASINPNPPSRCSGSEIKVGNGGKLLCAWSTVTSSTPYYENNCGFGYSTNAGVNWTINQSIFAMNGIGGLLPEKNNIRVNGIPRMAIDMTGGSRNGWIYIVTNEKNLSPAGSDPDIVFHRSTDGGNTWSAGIRVNQDALNNGKIQYFPAICVDELGGIDVLYYDDRNTTSDSAQVYLSRSNDGGNTWQDFRVSSHTFQPKPIIGFSSQYQGDFISLASKNGKLYPYWMDDYSPDYNGIYQIWSSVINLNQIGIRKIESTVPTDFSLSPNFPNPFNPETNIEFSLPKSGILSLKIYDINGREVENLFNGKTEAGKYRTVWNAKGNASGVYFLRAVFEGQIQTERLILTK